jgi:hypothetical protein
VVRLSIVVTDSIFCDAARRLSESQYRHDWQPEVTAGSWRITSNPYKCGAMQHKYVVQPSVPRVELFWPPNCTY